MKKNYPLLLATVCAFGLSVNAQTISTFAGNGSSGYLGDGLAATAAELSNPAGAVVDATGNVYVADAGNQVVRKINATTGVITTVAGTGTIGYSPDGGQATAGKLNTPVSVALDASGDLFISENGSNVIHKVVLSTGIMTTFVGNGYGPHGFAGDGGPATAAALWAPMGIAFDGAGNLYIADDSNNRVRIVTPTGTINTFAGTGPTGWVGAGKSGDGTPATAAKLFAPSGLAIDAAKNVYISDARNNCIRKVDGTTKTITTYAGNGAPGFLGDGAAAGSCEFNGLGGLAVDGDKNLYIADILNGRIRFINGTTFAIKTVAGGGAGPAPGDGGPAVGAFLATPASVCLDASWNFYIGDGTANRVRKVGVLKSLYEANASIPASESNLKVFPNPNKGTFSVLVNSENDEQATVVVTNIIGAKVSEFKTYTNKQLDMQLKAPSGIYFITAYTSTGKWCEKITITQ
jgi:sugar lactone lactonase YvrE